MQTDPKAWNIEESDLILSIFPAGSFARLMIGSWALYKETQRCIVLGFSDKIKQEQDLGILENDVLSQITQSLYCSAPDKQMALVLFVGDSSTTFIPEVRALDIASLCPIPTSFESSQKSILYEIEIVRAVMKILEVDVDENSPLALKQAQIQLLKIITFLVENEARLNGHSDFLNMLVETNLAKDLFSFLQRNANKPEISSKSPISKLPNELLELQLTSLRTKILESKLILFPNHGLQACLSENDTLTFFQ